MMAFPAIVCAAFSAEVGLKTMLTRNGLTAKGHDLRALYLKLPGETKYAIFEATGFSMEEFAAQLAHSRLAFSEWRYVYEENREMVINVNFLGKFASAVESVSLSSRSAA
jgi:HEPN domain-containing protein